MTDTARLIVAGAAVAAGLLWWRRRAQAETERGSKTATSTPGGTIYETAGRKLIALAGGAGDSGTPADTRTRLAVRTVATAAEQLSRFTVFHGGKK